MAEPSALTQRLRRIPYGDFPASDLMRAYMESDERILRYYEHDPWDSKAIGRTAEIAASVPRDRDTLANVLLEQNALWWGDEEKAVREHIERLRDPESVVVVTGQQLGLFGGPLYTVYKALTAVHLTAQLSTQTGRSVVPIFWLGDEDHDFAEAHSTALPNDAEPVQLTYDDGLPPEANRGPLGRIVFGDEIISVVDRLYETFPETPGLIRDLWKPGVQWRDAFAHTMRRLTAGSGLVFVSGDAPRLKRLATPLFQRELNHWKETHASLESVSQQLESDGFHAQVKPGELNLFLFEDGSRLQIDPGRDGFVLRSTEKRFTADDLESILKEHPERFSPNVVLRPLMQDMLLPTAAYVGGPGEIAYFAQLKPVYEAFGVPMPLVCPRVSLTLVTDKQQRFLDLYGIDIPELGRDLSELHRRLALERTEQDLDGRFEEVAQRLQDLISELKPLATSVDSSLDSAVEAAQARVSKAIGRLEKKTVRVEKRNQQVILDRLERLAGELMPFGKPQERVFCALNATGLNLATWLDHPGADSRAHLVVGV
ncbi:MAG: bacillithiol biosynthesis cysteine-adding enzyme BshC [Rubricoccaceae bacterium]|nr:bacillithiol biosynthesis cysteine-adding enzyme BshC [Rubricoccaceae bacterium]